MDKARGDLGALGKLSDKTEAAERAIMKRAAARLRVVNAQLERLRPGIEGAPDASQDRYTDLVSERGQLHVVISKAQAALQ
jgi:hypothetical protein